MVKQRKSVIKTECVGKGKVTPVQIAFIVDRYLSDDSFTQTRPIFRSEASHLVSKSPVLEAPKSLLTLEAILNEYVTLKEQKLWIDRERSRLEQEKLRVQNLLRGLQDVVNSYNAKGTDDVNRPLPLPPPLAMVSQPELSVMTPAGNYSMYKSPAMMSTNRPLNIATDSTNFSTPITSHATTKKKGSKDVSDCPVAAKRSRSCIQRNQQSSNRDKKGDESLTNSTTVLSTHDSVSNTSSLQGSNVVKCLFNQKTTPSQASPSHMEKSIYPSETCATSVSIKDHTPQTITSTNCTIISKATIRVSPTKQVGVAYYSIETNNQCLSTNSPRSNKKAKGWLDFHASDKPEIREKQTHNALELGFPNIEALGMEFNVSEFLVDLDNEGQELGLSSSQQA